MGLKSNIILPKWYRKYRHQTSCSQQSQIVVRRGPNAAYATPLLSTLPAEILLRITEYLPESVVMLSQTSQGFRHLGLLTTDALSASTSRIIYLGLLLKAL
jgi:hypothetical protein